MIERNLGANRRKVHEPHNRALVKTLAEVLNERLCLHGVAREGKRHGRQELHIAAVGKSECGRRSLPRLSGISEQCFPQASLSLIARSRLFFARPLRRLGRLPRKISRLAELA